MKIYVPFSDAFIVMKSFNFHLNLTEIQGKVLWKAHQTDDKLVITWSNDDHWYLGDQWVNVVICS